MKYIPRPIDTDHIELSIEILELTEKLAENIHDTWALGRMKEGWTYGKQRDDILKKHPDLVPYSQLTEGEKEYDRATALAALKSIISLGYTIQKDGGK
jgi:RyR domain